MFANYHHSLFTLSDARHHYSIFWGLLTICILWRIDLNFSGAVFQGTAWHAKIVCVVLCKSCHQCKNRQNILYAFLYVQNWLCYQILGKLYDAIEHGLYKELQKNT